MRSRHLFRYTRNHHAAKAVSNQNYVVQALKLYNICNVADVCRKIDICIGQMDPFAKSGQRWPVNNITSGP